MTFLNDLFQYQFFTNAFLAALLTSLACGIIGTYIVTKRIVFISGGITHASFGGIGIGYFAGISPIMGAAIFSVLSALGIEYFSRKGDIREDSMIAILWSFGMAIGIIFIFITPGYAPNLMSYLFGNILTVTFSDIILLLAINFCILLFFILLFNPILYIAFDESYAKTRNLPVRTIKYLLISLIALTIVFSIKVMGIILIISLLTIPQTTANIFLKNYKEIMILSVLIGFVGSSAGIIISYYINIPSGASIIFCLVIIFMLFRLTKQLLSRRKRV